MISIFPPAPAPEANHALHLSEHLAAAGAEVHVLCQAGGIASTRENVTVHPIATDWSWSDLPGLLRRIRACRPDAICLLYLGWIYNDHPMITFLPSICRRLFRGTPFVTQFEAIDETVRGRSRLGRIAGGLIGGFSRRVHPVFGTLLRDSDRVVALSSPHRDRLIGIYPPTREKISVLPPPPLIRMSREEPTVSRRRIRTEWGAAEGDVVFMYWGYIYPGKGVETLLRAFAGMLPACPTARLALVGGALETPSAGISPQDYARMVRALPERLGVADRVVWTGGFDWDSEAGSQYLFAADACVLPLDWGVTLNNSSLAAATTHGLPVIGTAVPDHPDEVLEHGRNICLVPPRDPAALAEAMTRLAVDDDYRERLRRGSRALAGAWHDPAAIAGRLLDILRLARTEARGPATRAAVAEQPPGAEARRPEVYPTEPPTPAAARGAEPHGAGAPLVSVVVAAYNVAGYLSQCLDALVNQTLTNIEIIVVDDASTDDSARIIAEYAARHPSIRVVTCLSNQGLASVRNIGILHARGGHVAFADGDDWVDVRMCEILHRRAVADDADVVSGSATVHYEDSKSFAPLFDHHVRSGLDPAIKAHPFALLDAPEALLLEVVAWTKLYKRSFLIENDLHFEDGMSSYEDICFHVFCMTKARRISVIDDPLVYYRQNRPGQISRMSNRKIFEVFEIFRRIHARLSLWNAPDAIWLQVLRLELRQYDWLLSDRVRPDDAATFMAGVAQRLRDVPASVWPALRHHGVHDSAKRVSLRRGWLAGYQLASRRATLPAFLICLLFAEGRRASQTGLRRGAATAARECLQALRSRGGRALARLGLRRGGWRPSAAAGDDWNPAGAAPPPAIAEAIHVRHIGNEMLLLTAPSGPSGFDDAVWRVTRDHYLAQFAVLREGDVVIDVGAQAGVWAIYLARRFPFVTVYALEPDPDAYACLLQNLALNDVTNVVAINVALAGESRGRTLYREPVMGWWSTVRRDFAATRQIFSIREVEATTMREFCEVYGIEHCRMVKISAWGAVKEILAQFGPVRVDYLCGEVDLRDCGAGALEAASARVARHFFWRTYADTASGRTWSSVQQPPRGPEAADARRARPIMHKGTPPAPLSQESPVSLSWRARAHRATG